jgi:hypothetical protein
MTAGASTIVRVRTRCCCRVARSSMRSSCDAGFVLLGDAAGASATNSPAVRRSAAKRGARSVVAAYGWDGDGSPIGTRPHSFGVFIIAIGPEGLSNEQGPKSLTRIALPRNAGEHD